jgi:hypothetical protein
MNKPQFLNEDASMPQIFNEIVSVKDLIKNAEGLVVIDEEKVRLRLQELHDKYKDMEPSEENLKEAIDARAELRQPRYDLDKIQKHNNSVIHKRMTDMKQHNEKLADYLRAIVGPLEEKFDKTIKEAQAKAEERRQAKEKAEQERVSNITQMINDWKDLLIKFESDIRLGKEKVSTLEAKLEELRLEFPKFEEFAYLAEQCISSYIDKFEELYTIEREFEEIAAKRKAEEEERAKQKELMDKKVNTFIQVLISKGAKMLDTDTYELDGTRFSRSIMGMTEIEQFNAMVAQAEESAKQRKEDEERRRKIREEEEALEAKRAQQRKEDEERAERIRKEDEERERKKREEEEAAAKAKRDAEETERKRKEAEEKQLAENIETVKQWNDLIEVAGSIGVDLESLGFTRTTLANVPSEEIIISLQDTIQIRKNEIEKLSKDEIRKLGAELKTKLVTAYVDHFQQKDTGNEYVDEQLCILMQEVENSIHEFGQKMFLSE